MKISEQQLLVLLDVVRHVIDCNVVGINFGYDKKHIAQLYENILNQQNEIVDTHHYGCRNDEYLRLAIDLFQSLEVSTIEKYGDAEPFYESPIGQRAREILYPKVKP